MEEAVSEEKRQLQIKHEKVCSDIKHLKQENTDLRKDLSSTNVALKAARKQVQEVQRNLKKTCWC
jgi:predicted  nucleic acid-binding Zn-ribbon protein